MLLNGIIYSHVVHGSFNGDSFQDYLVNLLRVMNPYLQKNSVLVMDNCLIQHVKGVAELCAERQVYFYCFILSF
ncbi:hypothetical protein K439DRAFT_1355949 [Ramaria rubella]|nr:hypothetical protein K439DRAFT_1355949 [Ramaria rubella]